MQQQTKTMQNLTKLIKAQREEFDKFKLEEYGKWKIGRVETKQFNDQSTKAILEKVIEMVDERLTNYCGSGKCNAIIDLKKQLQDTINKL